MMAGGARVHRPQRHHGQQEVRRGHLGRGDLLHRYSFFFFFTLVTGHRRSLSLKLSDTTVYVTGRYWSYEGRRQESNKWRSRGTLPVSASSSLFWMGQKVEATRKLRPEYGLDCLACAIFVRQRYGEAGLERLEMAWDAAGERLHQSFSLAVRQREN